jgi:hypothetical protein
VSTKKARTPDPPAEGDGWVGVDIGGTGIKAGLVDISKGTLIGSRIRVPTPHPSTRWSRRRRGSSRSSRRVTRWASASRRRSSRAR